MTANSLVIRLHNNDASNDVASPTEHELEDEVNLLAKQFVSNLNITTEITPSALRVAHSIVEMSLSHLCKFMHVNKCFFYINFLDMKCADPRVDQWISLIA
jgi:hypothetical protein